MPIHSLTVAKGGARLGSPALAFVIYPGRAKLPARNATVGEFAPVLQRAALAWLVVDQTGIGGRFDFGECALVDEWEKRPAN